MHSLYDYFSPTMVSLITIVMVVITLTIGNYLMSRVRQQGPNLSLQRQLLKLLLMLSGVVIIIISLPVSPGLRGQILSFLGLLISAAIALSSTTFLGNIMAGIMLRIINNYRVGDFVLIKEHFGRVTGNSIFHLEIQSEDRNLITLPNLFVVTNPVKVFPPTGTVINAEVSLGYDVPRAKIERLLLVAAERAGLEAPFVHIVALGDFSVNYRVSGLLKDVFQLLSARSKLRTQILDTLHEEGVEIVSPRFMNQRQVGEALFIPPVTYGPEPDDTASKGDEVVFDKADKATELEHLRTLLEETEEKLKKRQEQLGTVVYKYERQAIEQDIRSKKRIKKDLEEHIKSIDKELKSMDRGT